MSDRRHDRALALATLLWTAMWCGDLIEAWRHSPFDRLGWFAAAGWLAWVGRATAPERGTLAGWLAHGGSRSWASQGSSMFCNTVRWLWPVPVGLAAERRA